MSTGKLAHAFGGSWTEEKLACLSAYLVTYREIFTKNPKASYFKTWYVDAFAGTGTRSQSSSGGLIHTSDDLLDTDTTNYFAGSAQIALGLESPFDNYLFIEKSKRRVSELNNVIDAFPSIRPRVQVKNEDANTALRTWCSQRNWGKERAVVFLDPYGMQVEWETIETLGRTKAVDLWYLFPFVNRLLRQDGNLDETWVNRLDKLFGTHDWEDRFYEKQQIPGLFGEIEEVRRDATVSNVQSFTEERLRSCFAQVAPSLILKNSKGSPLYAFCFAASNEKGAPIGVRIAKSILKG